MEIVHQNAISLAWMGDAIMTMYVRKHFLLKGIQNPHKLQRMSAKVCSAKGQSVILDTLIQEDFFNADEKEILCMVSVSGADGAARPGGGVSRRGFLRL